MHKQQYTYVLSEQFFVLESGRASNVLLHTTPTIIVTLNVFCELVDKTRVNAKVVSIRRCIVMAVAFSSQC